VLVLLIPLLRKLIKDEQGPPEPVASDAAVA
jgi:hypothetical protein